MLLRVSELRERRLWHHVGGCAAGWYTAVLSTLRARGLAPGGS